MKRFELDSSKYTEEQREQAYKKLEELGYVPDIVHGTDDFNGSVSISAYEDGEYCGFDYACAMKGMIITFDELMQMKKGGCDMTELLDKLKAVTNLPRGEYYINVLTEDVMFSSVEIGETITVNAIFEDGDSQINFDDLPDIDKLNIILALYKHLR